VDLAQRNVHFIFRLIIKGRGTDVVDLIYKVSTENRACKQTPTLYALAICARSTDRTTKAAAYNILSSVCRIPTHLFEFVNYCEKESGDTTGWGRAQFVYVLSGAFLCCFDALKKGFNIFFRFVKWVLEVCIFQICDNIFQDPINFFIPRFSSRACTNRIISLKGNMGTTFSQDANDGNAS
jgi:hypothetical protein